MRIALGLLTSLMTTAAFAEPVELAVECRGPNAAEATVYFDEDIGAIQLNLVHLTKAIQPEDGRYQSGGLKLPQRYPQVHDLDGIRVTQEERPGHFTDLYVTFDTKNRISISRTPDLLDDPEPIELFCESFPIYNL